MKGLAFWAFSAFFILFSTRGRAMGVSASSEAPNEVAEPATARARNETPTTWTTFEHSEPGQAPRPLGIECDICKVNMSGEATHTLIKPCNPTLCAPCGLKSALANLHNLGECPCKDCSVVCDSWEIRTHVPRVESSRRQTRSGQGAAAAADASGPTIIDVSVLRATPPSAPLPNATVLPEFQKFNTAGSEEAKGSLWVGYQVAGEGAFEHVFGLDPAGDRAFAAGMGKVQFRRRCFVWPLHTHTHLCRS